ncbi:MAG: hypothetical protein CM1200mP18_03080 [Gammaproteobacteria bacterium]|nr:MAG: hypothetical protein CM1200mP18_03080 [Gammaproteobacteria bacterium]
MISFPGSFDSQAGTTHGRAAAQLALAPGPQRQGRGGVPALLELIIKVSDFAAVPGDALRALDLNPVIVHPRGNGITIADVLIEPS